MMNCRPSACHTRFTFGKASLEPVTWCDSLSLQTRNEDKVNYFPIWQVVCPDKMLRKFANTAILLYLEAVTAYPNLSKSCCHQKPTSRTEAAGMTTCRVYLYSLHLHLQICRCKIFKWVCRHLQLFTSFWLSGDPVDCLLVSVHLV